MGRNEIHFYATQDDKKLHSFTIERDAHVTHVLRPPLELVPLMDNWGSGVTVDRDGSLYVVSEGSKWLLHLSPRFEVLRKIDIGAAGLREIEDISIDRYGDIWILSDYNDKPLLHKLWGVACSLGDPLGAVLARQVNLSNLYSGLAGNPSPQGFTVDHFHGRTPQESFWVIDNQADDGIVFSVDEDFKDRKILPKFWGDSFDSPQSITVADDGRVWIAGYKRGTPDEEGHLMALDRSSGEILRHFRASDFGAQRATTGICWNGFRVNN